MAEPVADRPQRIRDALDALDPLYLDVRDESGQHAVPRGAQSHMRVVIVSDRFTSLPRVARHRLVNDALSGELESGLHALAIEASTPAEWEQRGGARLQSPPCHGGSRHDHL